MISAALFVLAFAGLLLLALLRHPIFGLHLYLLSFYVHPPARWWNYLLPDVRWSLVASVVAILGILIHAGRLANDAPRKRWIPLSGVLLLALVAWLWLQNLWALDEVAHLDASIQYTKYLALFTAFYLLAGDPKWRHSILLSHVFGCTFLGLLVLLAPYESYVDGRVNGVGGPGINDANTLCMHLATGAIVAATLMISLRGWKQYACIAAMPLIANGMIAAGSRGAFLGFLAAGMVLLWAKPPHAKKLFWTFAGLGACLFVVLAGPIFASRIASIGNITEGEEAIDGSAESRLHVIRSQLAIVGDYPFGGGHKATPILAPVSSTLTHPVAEGEQPRAGQSLASHNTFMTLLTEQGLPGAGLYLGVLLVGLGRLWRLKARATASAHGMETTTALACMAALTVTLVAGLFTDYFMCEVQIWMFAILAATGNTLPARSVRPATPPTGARLPLVRAVPNER